MKSENGVGNEFSVWKSSSTSSGTLFFSFCFEKFAVQFAVRTVPVLLLQQQQQQI
jgi:hypothetical protein